MISDRLEYQGPANIWNGTMYQRRKTKLNAHAASNFITDFAGILHEQFANRLISG